MRRVLVVGATGNVGKHLTARLIDRGAEVIAASRSGKPVADAAGLPFDYREPERFSEISRGIDAAYLMMPTGYPEGLNALGKVLEIAREQRIRIVLHTALEAHLDRAHHYAPLEDLLMSSGVSYSIIRPSWYMQNFLHFWPTQIAQGLLELPAGNGRMSLVDVRDIADSAAAVVLNEKWSGQAFHITGPRAYSFNEALRVLSREAKRPLEFHSISEEEMIRRSIARGLSRSDAAFFAAAYAQIRSGNTELITSDVEMLTGKPPRTLEAYAAEICGALQ